MVTTQVVLVEVLSMFPSRDDNSGVSPREVGELAGRGVNAALIPQADARRGHAGGL